MQKLYIGVDVGKKLYYAVRTKERIISFGTVKDFEELIELIDKYNLKGMSKVKQVVIDALPETRKVYELIKKYPDIVKKCYFIDESYDDNKYYKVEDDRIKVDRVVATKITFADFYGEIIEIKTTDGRLHKYHLTLYDAVLFKNFKYGNKFAKFLQLSIELEEEDKICFVDSSNTFYSFLYAKLAVDIFN